MSPGEKEEDMYGYAMQKEEFQSRLAKVEGQVRGLQRMIEEDKYCIDILTQLNATAAALKSIGVGLLDSHVRHCVREGIERGQGDAEIELLVAAVARFVGR
jgi:DNA-binding FrmR family transcriptional regulator